MAALKGARRFFEGGPFLLKGLEQATVNERVYRKAVMPQLPAQPIRRRSEFGGRLFKRDFLRLRPVGAIGADGLRLGMGSAICSSISDTTLGLATVAMVGGARAILMRHGSCARLLAAAGPQLR